MLRGDHIASKSAFRIQLLRAQLAKVPRQEAFRRSQVFCDAIPCEQEVMARVQPLLAVLVSSASALQPVLRFRDPKTRGDVILVGCMHYNPASIALASSIVREEASAKRLRACVVESCPTRWNSTLAMQPQGSLYRAIFDNEMQAAADVAEEYGCMVKVPPWQWQCPSSAPAPSRGALAAPGSSALPGRGGATGRPATASGARASRLQNRRQPISPPLTL